MVSSREIVFYSENWFNSAYCTFLFKIFISFDYTRFYIKLLKFYGLFNLPSSDLEAVCKFVFACGFCF